ncbi:hypothetical protein FB45DRAFT_904863 [Roridomyces roridus]|uniref:Protein kinase domain-containing protein n=2 Tax=Mycenaceae TaxID=2024004 RepID=A0AAD7C5A1_9AGAR|nr:hypothetical protein C8R44DRAFT_807100 [Mycena epipterygia]KAJ7639158.1 hypothetical protein FB45DRAFT_904863 [Roridomyces roridus]
MADSKNSNTRKLAAYDALTPLERKRLKNADYNAAMDWLVRTELLSHNCEEALDLCEMVPPVRLGGKSTKTKDISTTEMMFPALQEVALDPHWLDNVITATNFRNTPVSSDDRMNLTPHLSHNRRAPPPKEEVERTTDHFHQKYILDPASVIAGIMTGQAMVVTFSPHSDGVVGDLKVHAEDDSDRNFITAEDKRGLVWAKHEDDFLALLAQPHFPEIKPADNPKPAVRMCVQIHVQMHIYRVFYAKLFSPVGVVYVRRDSRENRLVFSRVYHNLNGDVRRTACLLIQAFRYPGGHDALSPPSVLSYFPVGPTRSIASWIRRQGLKLFLTVSALCGMPRVAIGLHGRWSLFRALDDHSPMMLPRIFTRYIGAGASGNVWQSADGSHVIKIFRDEEAARNEAEILQRCLQDPELPVPTFRGLYADRGNRFGIVTTYVGTALGPIYDAEESKQYQLANALRALHRNGIHHHDIRPDNVMVNKQGGVTLIDFDRACQIDGPCENCSDLAVISAIEGDTRDSSGRSISPYSV